MRDTLTDALIDEAFRRAGWSNLRPILQAIMRQSIIKGNGRSTPSCNYFIAALVEANDANLVWDLFQSVQQTVIERLFIETVNQMRPTQPIDGEGATKGMPRGQFASAFSPSSYADREASGLVPTGQANSASRSAPDVGEGAESNLPRGHIASAPSPAGEGGGAVRPMPQGQRIVAPPSLPPPLSPAARRASFNAHKRAAHAASGFFIYELNGARTLIDDVLYHRLPALHRMYGKRMYGTALQYRVIELIMKRGGNNVEKGKLVGEVCDKKTISDIVIQARRAIEGNSVVVPAALAPL